MTLRETFDLEHKVKILRFELHLASQALGWCATQFEDRQLIGSAHYARMEKERVELLADWGPEEAPPR